MRRPAAASRGIELFSSKGDIVGHGTTEKVQPRRRAAEGIAGLLEIRVCAHYATRPRTGHRGEQVRAICRVRKQGSALPGLLEILSRHQQRRRVTHGGAARVGKYRTVS